MTRNEEITRLVEQEVEKDEDFIRKVKSTICVFCDPFGSTKLCSTYCPTFQVLEVAEEHLRILLEEE